MTRVYFVRHAQPEHSCKAETRPLTEEGKRDSEAVTEFLKDKNIDVFYCSPYKRSRDTIASSVAYYGAEVIIKEDLREREAGQDGNHNEMFRKRWENFDFHEPGGESIGMVQKRNIAALQEILKESEGKNIVIGTHGTALSSILNFYDSTIDCDFFLRIIDWMPFVLEIDFEGMEFVGEKEHLHIYKEFKG